MKLRLRIILLCVFVLVSGAAQAADDAAARLELLGRYQALKPHLQKNDYGLPINIESIEKDDFVCGEVYGVVDYPFSRVQQAAVDPHNWCDIIMLHINAKAAIYSKDKGRDVLTVFTGKSKYQEPDENLSANYFFNVESYLNDYTYITLTAPTAPMDTRNHRIEFEAVPLSSGKSFVHMSYSYEFGSLAGTVMRAYMKTAARDRVGFTVVEQQKDGDPVYVDGVRGAIERNAVRYYFAIAAYLEDVGGSELFAKRINNWYDLTERYEQQLHVVDKQDYLRNKTREYQNHQQMQRDVAGRLAGEPAINQP